MTVNLTPNHVLAKNMSKGKSLDHNNLDSDIRHIRPITTINHSAKRPSL